MKENESQLDEIINTTFSKVKDLIDNNTIIGKTTKLNDNNYIVPISKLSFGIISGGFEKPNKNKKNTTACSTTGVNIFPIGFITICNNSIDFLPTYCGNNYSEVIANKLCNLVDNVIKSKGEFNEK